MSSETTKTGNAGLVKIAPVMFAFFVMGFVDLVGTATNYVKAEFNLANGTANLFTTMVFFWFLIFAVPTGMLMNKIGRRKTVLWSILVTLVAMALPIIAYVALSGTARLVLIVISFAFLGIGNTLMQVSLNPLLTVFVKGDQARLHRRSASSSSPSPPCSPRTSPSGAPPSSACGGYCS